MEAVVGSVDFSMCVYLYVRREGCICPVILLRVVLMQCLSFIYVLCIPAILCAVSSFLFDPHAVSMFASVQIWKEKRGEEGSEGRSAATKVRPPE